VPVLARCVPLALQPVFGIDNALCLDHEKRVAPWLVQRPRAFDVLGLPPVGGPIVTMVGLAGADDPYLAEYLRLRLDAWLISGATMPRQTRGSTRMLRILGDVGRQ
jgi:hypothetical protein